QRALATGRRIPRECFPGRRHRIRFQGARACDPCLRGARQSGLPAAPHVRLGRPTNGQLFRNRRRFGRTLSPPIPEHRSLPCRDSCRSRSRLLAHSPVVRARSRNLFRLSLGLDRPAKSCPQSSVADAGRTPAIFLARPLGGRVVSNTGQHHEENPPQPAEFRLAEFLSDPSHTLTVEALRCLPALIAKIAVSGVRFWLARFLGVTALLPCIRRLPAPGCHSPPGSWPGRSGTPARAAPSVGHVRHSRSQASILPGPFGRGLNR